MPNLLLEDIEYKIDKTLHDFWRRHLHPNGRYFAEFKTRQTWFGWPLLHYTHGICPETGRTLPARGIVGVGRKALGIVAIGQAACGIVAIGQLAIGLIFGLGQASTGAVAIGQLALGIWFGLGQIATGGVVSGQFAFGKYVLAQLGFGRHVWSQESADPVAVEFFESLPEKITNWF